MQFSRCKYLKRIPQAYLLVFALMVLLQSSHLVASLLEADVSFVHAHGYDFLVHAGDAVSSDKPVDIADTAAREAAALVLYDILHIDVIAVASAPQGSYLHIAAKNGKENESAG